VLTLPLAVALVALVVALASPPGPPIPKRASPPTPPVALAVRLYAIDDDGLSPLSVLEAFPPDPPLAPFRV
jgi:hypothetical protein